MNSLNINIVVGATVLAVGVLGATFAKKVQFGIGGKQFSPNLITRLLVASVAACVGFNFVYTGLGSPQNLTVENAIAMIGLESFMISGFVAGLVTQFRVFTRAQQVAAAMKVRATVLGLAFLICISIVARDLLHRFRLIS
jgi:hypothetical protein